MKCTGSCECKQVKVVVSVDERANNLHPRVCDCDYCNLYPAPVISHPTMKIEVFASLANLKIDKNGDELARFYRCPNCNNLIIVGCEIDEQLRGAVNAGLLTKVAHFGGRIKISPKKLTAQEKLERWRTLWGKVIEDPHHEAAGGIATRGEHKKKQSRH